MARYLFQALLEQSHERRAQAHRTRTKRRADQLTAHFRRRRMLW